MEWDYIYKARRECFKKGWRNINREVQDISKEIKK